MFLKKRNNNKHNLTLRNGAFFCQDTKIGQRDTIIFECLKCGGEASRRVSLWKSLNNVFNEDLFCEKCTRAKNNIKKYGVENPMQIEKVVSKLKKSNIKKYGVENPMQIESIAKKSGESRRKISYKDRRIWGSALLKTNFEDYTGTNGNYAFVCTECGEEFNFNVQNPQRTPHCPTCTPKQYSIKENEIALFIKSLGFKIIRNSKKIISPLEIDIYIPSKKIAIEFNGLYWHSDLVLGEKARKYHLSKLEKCIEKGIFLIQIFEDEWDERKAIVKNRIKSLLGICDEKIFARKCIVKEISVKEKNKFLEGNHLQGQDKSNIKLGAYYEKELVAVMTFSVPRHFMGGKEGFELSRFAVKGGFAVVGIASKVLKYFIKKQEPKYIYTYSDKRWSSGNLYKTIGFEYSSSSAPNYWYIKSGRRLYRYNFRKSELSKKLVQFDENLTEHENMIRNGYAKIWDCGNDRWEMSFI